MWKAMKNAIPIGENLKFRGINTTATCPHCGLEESMNHLFFFCSFVKQVWVKASFKQLPVFVHNTSLRAIIEASRTFVVLPPTGLVNGPLFPWLLWSIWTTRNKKIFENRQVKASDVISQAMVQAKEWITAQSLATPPQALRVPVLTPVIQLDTIRVFSDAAWEEDSHKAGLGWIMFDPLREIEFMEGGSVQFISSPLMAEAMALHLAINQAINFKFTNI
ncbi:putative ribonuclease H-like superfamily, reverse transcriptase zinc-binding protein [Arabidopsis thaliana]